MSRSRKTRLGDRLISKALGLPAATHDYSVERDVPIAMRDGVVLRADHYSPVGPARGTLLFRSPYGRAGAFGVLFARPFAERGFHVVGVSCRATFGSGGEANAFAGEVEDGADTVQWLREQPWFTGTFATVGISYIGLTQWALLVDPPPEMRAAVIVSGPHDTGRLMYGSGPIALQSVAGWTHAVLHQEDHGPVRGLLRAVVQKDKPIRPFVDGLPLGDAARATFGDTAPWLDRWFAHPDPTDPFWDSARVTEALQRCEVPVLLYSGWQDLILEQVLESYDALHARDVDVALVVGPWNHGELSSKAAGQITRESLAWFAEHLVGDGKRLEASPVRIEVTGTDAWRDLPEWPPPTAPRTLYLRAGGGLDDAAPADTDEPSRFTYDPADPTPTVGGMTNALDAGRRDNRDREKRSDVLTFTSALLTEPVEVVGAPQVELVHDSDNPFLDVFVRLCEVDAKGRSWNLSERYVRLSEPVTTLSLELSPTAHCFAPGTRIRLQVSGGSHPQHDRNLGTGEPAATGSTLRPSHRTVAHGKGGVSSLVLPLTVAT